MKQHVKTSLLKSAASDYEAPEADAATLLRLVLQDRNCGTWRMDLPTYTCQWSPAALQLHGLDPDTGSLGLDRAIRVYHPYDAKMIANLVRDAILEKTGFRYVARLTRPGGGLRLIEALAAIELSDSGRVKAMIGIFRDVTEACAVKDAADSRGAMLRSIIRNSPTPTAMLDRNMNYMEVSRSWYRYHKLPPNIPLIGQSHYAVIRGIPAKWRVEHQRALRGEAVVRDKAPMSADAEPSGESGSIVLPWHTPSGKVGGLILMVTPRAAQSSGMAA